MWLLSFIPDSLIHLVLFIGIVGVCIGLLPIVPNMYRLQVYLVSVLLVGFGSFFEGIIYTVADYEVKIKDLEIKLAKKEVESQKVNTKIVTKIVTEKQIITEKGDTIIEYIDREVSKNDGQCNITSSVIKAHNAAATNTIELLSNQQVSPALHDSLATMKLAPKK